MFLQALFLGGRFAKEISFVPYFQKITLPFANGVA
jgi:hypothetical protein